MPDQYYDSTLTGKQLDAAFLQMQNIQQTATQVQSNATAAAQSASQAASSASAASGSASQASTSAGQAAESAADASGRADAAAESARQAAASAASIEGDAEQAASSASAAAQSATQASGSASAAAQSASAAADSEDSVQQNAAAAQQAAAAASQSKSDAEAAASNAASSASTAQQAASLIEENLSAIQAAPSNAQAAQQAAAQAAASASAAEDAAERAEQIADFNPADFATAAQGTKADTAVQSVNGKSGTAVTLTPADIGAATAAQGAKADTAVQSVNGAKPDSSGNVQLDLTTGTVRSVNGKDPDGSGNVQLSAGDVGAAEPLIGTTDTLTPQQVRDALLAGRLCVVTNATGGDDHTVAEWAVISSCVQGLSAWALKDLGSGQQLHLSELCGYFDERGWVFSDIYAPVLPEITAADNGKTVSAQNGVWALADAASGGGKMTLLYNNKSVTTFIPGEPIRFNAAGYDAIGIVSRHRASDDFYSPMQIVEFNNEPYTTCMLYAVGMDSRYGPEISAREVSVASGSIVAQDRGYYYNWSAHEADDGACIPVQVWGIKF